MRAIADLDQPSTDALRLQSHDIRRFPKLARRLQLLNNSGEGMMRARVHTKIAPRLALKATWGGARNRRGRTSLHLTRSQVEGMIAATAKAQCLGIAFNRHWAIHYESAGIAESDGARFVGHLLKLAREYASRVQKGHFAAAWVREGGDGKGGHVHILMHLPAGCTLHGRTRKWVRLAGGKYRARVSFTRSIGGNLKAAQSLSEHYLQNAATVLGYVLKGASREAGEALSLSRSGESGLIIGKRCGWTQNIGESARG